MSIEFRGFRPLYVAETVCTDSAQEVVYADQDSTGSREATPLGQPEHPPSPYQDTPPRASHSTPTSEQEQPESALVTPDSTETRSPKHYSPPRQISKSLLSPTPPPDKSTPSRQTSPSPLTTSPEQDIQHRRTLSPEKSSPPRQTSPSSQIIRILHQPAPSSQPNPLSEQQTSVSSQNSNQIPREDRIGDGEQLFHHQVSRKGQTNHQANDSPNKSSTGHHSTYPIQHSTPVLVNNTANLVSIDYSLSEQPSEDQFSATENHNSSAHYQDSPQSTIQQPPQLTQNHSPSNNKQQHLQLLFVNSPKTKPQNTPLSLLDNYATSNPPNESIYPLAARESRQSNHPSVTDKPLRCIGNKEEYDKHLDCIDSKKRRNSEQNQHNQSNPVKLDRSSLNHNDKSIKRNRKPLKREFSLPNPELNYPQVEHKSSKKKHIVTFDSKAPTIRSDSNNYEESSTGTKRDLPNLEDTPSGSSRYVVLKSRVAEFWQPETLNHSFPEISAVPETEDKKPEINSVFAENCPPDDFEHRRVAEQFDPSFRHFLFSDETSDNSDADQRLQNSFPIDSSVPHVVDNREIYRDLQRETTRETDTNEVFEDSGVNRQVEPDMSISRQKYDHHKVSFYIDLFENADTTKPHGTRPLRRSLSQTSVSAMGCSDLQPESDTVSLAASEPAIDISDNCHNVQDYPDNGNLDPEDMSLEEVMSACDRKGAMFMQMFSGEPHQPHQLHQPQPQPQYQQHYDDQCEYDTMDGGIDRLQNLVTIMRQLANLRNENNCLRRRCDYLYNAQKFVSLRNTLNAMTTARASRREKYAKAKHYDPHSSGHEGTSSKPSRYFERARMKRALHQRSQSMGSIDALDAAAKSPGTDGKQTKMNERRTRNVKKNKRFSSKWHRMKKVFSGKPEQQSDEYYKGTSAFDHSAIDETTAPYTPHTDEKYTPVGSEAEPSCDPLPADIDASNPCSPKSPSRSDTLDRQSPRQSASRPSSDHPRDAHAIEGRRRGEQDASPDFDAECSRDADVSTDPIAYCSSDGEEVVSRGAGAGSTNAIDRLRVQGAPTTHCSTHSLATSGDPSLTPLTPETGYASQAVLNDDGEEEEAEEDHVKDVVNSLSRISQVETDAENRDSTHAKEATGGIEKQLSPWTTVKDFVNTEKERRRSLQKQHLQQQQQQQSPPPTKDQTQSSQVKRRHDEDAHHQEDGHPNKYTEDQSEPEDHITRKSTDTQYLQPDMKFNSASPPSCDLSAISEDFHAKMLQWEDKKGKHLYNDQISSVFTDEFIRKMDQWEMIKGLNESGSVVETSPVMSDVASECLSSVAPSATFSPTSSCTGNEERLSKSFTRTVQEWKKLREKRVRDTSSPTGHMGHGSRSLDTRSKSRERDRSRHKLEKEKQKIERKEQKIEKERSKLVKMKMRLTDGGDPNSSSSESRANEGQTEPQHGDNQPAEVHSSTSGGGGGGDGHSGLSDDFRRKLAEWEELKSSLATPSPSNSEKRKRRQTTCGEGKEEVSIDNKDRRKTFDSVSQGMKEQRSRGVSDSSLDALNRENHGDSPMRDGSGDSLKRDVDSKKRKSLDRDSLKRISLRHKFSQTDSHAAGERRTASTNRRGHEVKRSREVSEDTVRELRNGLIQLRQYGDSLASRKQIVEMKVKADATARNKIESILLEEIESLQVSLAKGPPLPQYPGEAHFEKLFTLVKRSQTQLHVLKMGILERNQVIDELQRHLLVQEVTNRLLEAQSVQRASSKVKRWQTFAGNDFYDRDENEQSADELSDECHVGRKKSKNRIVLNSCKALQGSIGKLSHGNVDSLTLHFDLLDAIRAEIRGQLGCRTSDLQATHDRSVQTVMTLYNRSSNDVLATLPQRIPETGYRRLQPTSPTRQITTPLHHPATPLRSRTTPLVTVNAALTCQHENEAEELMSETGSATSLNSVTSQLTSQLTVAEQDHCGHGTLHNVLTSSQPVVKAPLSSQRASSEVDYCGPATPLVASKHRQQKHGASVAAAKQATSILVTPTSTPTSSLTTPATAVKTPATAKATCSIQQDENTLALTQKCYSSSERSIETSTMSNSDNCSIPVSVEGKPNMRSAVPPLKSATQLEHECQVKKRKRRAASTGRMLGRNQHEILDDDCESLSTTGACESESSASNTRERGRSTVARRGSRRGVDERSKRSSSLESVGRVSSASVDSEHRVPRFASAMQKRLTTTLPKLRRRKTTELAVVQQPRDEEPGSSRSQKSGLSEASHWLQKPKKFFKTAKW